MQDGANSFREFKWPSPTSTEIQVLFAFIIVVLLVIIVLQIYLFYKRKGGRAKQLFLIKARQMGLNTFEIKLLQEMNNALSNQNPVNILKSEPLFEKGLIQLMSQINRDARLENISSSEKSIFNIASDIIILREKLFRKENFDKPLYNLENIESGSYIAIYLILRDQVFIGRLRAVKADRLIIDIIYKSKRRVESFQDEAVEIFFWRKGDSQYQFQSKLLKNVDRVFEISFPGKFVVQDEILEQTPSYRPKSYVVIKDGVKPRYLNADLKKLGRNSANILTNKELPIESHNFLYLIVGDLQMHIPIQHIEEIVPERQSIVKKKYEYALSFQISQLGAEIIDTYFQV